MKRDIQLDIETLTHITIDVLTADLKMEQDAIEKLTKKRALKSYEAEDLAASLKYAAALEIVLAYYGEH
jgi:hypothetical protein